MHQENVGADAIISPKYKGSFRERALRLRK